MSAEAPTWEEANAAFGRLCGGRLAPEQLYSYRWGNNPKRATLKDRMCRIVARGAKNTVLVEFLDNGERVTTSLRALKRIDS